jgi:4-carboxymuconolactone decarboxylase
MNIDTDVRCANPINTGSDMSTQRVPPLAVSDVPDETAAELAAVSQSDQGIDNIYLYLMRHPRLFHRWGQYGGMLLSGTLSERERELAVLRVQHRAGDRYDWCHHVLVARRTGMTDVEIARLQSDETHGWEPHDAVIVRAVDELIDDHIISDNTWAELAAHHTVEQLVELPLLIGQYLSLAFAMRSLGVPLEASIEGQFS